MKIKRHVAHLSFLAFIRNFSPNPLFICLAKHFLAPFFVSSLSIMLCYVCMYPKPHSQFSAPFPLPIQPCKSMLQSPSLSLGQALSPLHSSQICPAPALSAQLGCRMDLAELGACLEQSWPTSSWEQLCRERLCAAAQQAQLCFQSDVYRLASLRGPLHQPRD